MSYEQTRNIFNAYLELYKIKYECHKLFGGYQWTFPEYPDADIICHKGSYYSDIGYVESFGFSILFSTTFTFSTPYSRFRSSINC